MKHASYIGTRPGLMGLGNALIRLRLRGNASHCETVFEPGDGVDHLMPDGTCEPDADGRLWCASSVGLERLPSYSRRRPGRLGGVRFKRIDVSGPEWELIPTDTQPLYAANTAAFYEGARYDWAYILGFVAWFLPQRNSRMACSEACATFMGFSEPHRFDPCSLRAAIKAGQ